MLNASISPGPYCGTRSQVCARAGCRKHHHPRRSAARTAALCGRHTPGLHPASAARPLRLFRHARRAHPRPGGDCAHQQAGDPAGLYRRLDLPTRGRSSAGDGARRAWAQAISLSRRLARLSRCRQVRAAAGLRGSAAVGARGDHRPFGGAGPVARKDAGDGGLPAGRDAGARGQRGVCARQPVLRAHDVAQSARRGPRQHGALSVSRQERCGARRVGIGPAPGAHHPALRRSAGAGIVPVHRRSWRAPCGRFHRCECLLTGDFRRGFHGEGLPHLGRQRAGAGSAARAHADERYRGAPAGGGGCCCRGPAPREHTGRLPQVLCAPGRGGRVPGGRTGSIAPDPRAQGPTTRRGGAASISRARRRRKGHRRKKPA